MIIQGQVGPQFLMDGTEQPVRQGRGGDVIVSELHGRYFEQAMRGNIYTASTQAAVALTTTLSTTATGLILTNPAGSNIYVVLLELLVALATAPAGAATIALAANVNPVAAAVTHTTPLTVRKMPLGLSGVGAALADSAATLPAVPVCIRSIPGGPVGATSITPPFMRDEIAGAVILAPGTSVNTFCLTTAISALITATWEEVPI